MIQTLVIYFFNFYFILLFYYFTVSSEGELFAVAQRVRFWPILSKKKKKEAKGRWRLYGFKAVSVLPHQWFSPMLFAVGKTQKPQTKKRKYLSNISFHSLYKQCNNNVNTLFASNCLIAWACLVRAPIFTWIFEGLLWNNIAFPLQLEK